jgi:hypothetical protein
LSFSPASRTERKYSILQTAPESLGAYHLVLTPTESLKRLFSEIPALAQSA